MLPIRSRHHHQRRRRRRDAAAAAVVVVVVVVAVVVVVVVVIVVVVVVVVVVAVVVVVVAFVSYHRRQLSWSVGRSSSSSFLSSCRLRLLGRCACYWKNIRGPLARTRPQRQAVTNSSKRAKAAWSSHALSCATVTMATPAEASSDCGLL
jgi:hypothetical protein